ncbi:MAG: GxxExxY protein [Planctomycetes bacterium]|nr:GxxExxY protein [Planctomycetota bacterium]
MLTKRQPQIHTDAHRKAVNEITESIIGCAFRVANTLGCGFLEKVYENAMSHELTKCGMVVPQQAPLTVHYDDTIVGHYTADLLVDDQVIVELKAVKALDEVHMAQCLNYLKATHLPVCLLINFGRPKIQIKRLVS